MIKLIKNTLYRISNEKSFLIVYLVLIPIVIGLAVYFTNTMSSSVNIGIIGDIKTVENKRVTYISLPEVPEKSDFVLSKYDAVLMQEDTGIKVLSTKGEEFEQGIQLLVQGKISSLPNIETKRGVATNILGFLMMIISLLGVQIYQFYFSERNGINKRIMGTSISTHQYMLSHYIVGFLFLVIPSTIIISLAIILFNITIAIPMWQFIGMLFLLCFFATSFGLFINSISKTMEESMMFGNMFAIAGVIIAGGFVQVTDNEIFNTIIQILPQKQIMAILESLEKATTFSYIGMIYIIGFSILLTILGIVIEKRKLPNRL